MTTPNFFNNSPATDTTFFDEGPVVTVSARRGVNTGSIDTSLIDGYRQGVELTQQKHYDAGIGKIYAGEPGSVLRRNRLGMDRNYFPNPTFADIDYFNPVNFLRSQQFAGPESLPTITYPIIVGDNDQMANYVLDGTIEPLTIRSVVSFTNIDSPFNSHEISSELMMASPDQTRSACMFTTVDYFDPAPEVIPYLDLVDMYESHTPLNGYFQFNKARAKPFVDARYVRNSQSGSSDKEVIAALSLMTGSSDNYISFKEVSSTSGWYYDNVTSIGSDSIAFGGLTHLCQDQKFRHRERSKSTL